MNHLNHAVRILAALPFLITAALLCLAGRLTSVTFHALSNAFCSVGAFLYGIPMPKDVPAAEPNKG